MRCRPHHTKHIALALRQQAKDAKQRSEAYRELNRVQRLVQGDDERGDGQADDEAREEEEPFYGDAVDADRGGDGEGGAFWEGWVLGGGA